jgi:CheY-like chemotaxis protein
MTESILNGKKLLIVDDEPDVLGVLEEEIHDACGNCSVDKATSYDEAVQLLQSNYYDLAILASSESRLAKTQGRYVDGPRLES